MGRPKQLLELEGKPLIARAVEAALGSTAWPVIVVLGANSSLIRPRLAKYPVVIAENFEWEEGMASSIRVGVAMAERFSLALEGLLFAVCDQPHFTSTVVEKLVRALDPTHSIAGARYGGRVGVPALFLRQHFEALKQLKGPEGAKPVLKSHAAEIAPVDLPELEVDLDTFDEYLRAAAESAQSAD